MLFRVFVAFLASLLIWMQSPSAGLVIDDFEAGPLFADDEIVVTQDNLDPTHVVGGERHVNYYNRQRGGSLRIGPDFEVITEPQGRNYFTISYGMTSSLNLDLSDYTAIQFEFTSSTNGSIVDSVDFVLRTDGAGQSTFRITIEEDLGNVVLPLSQAAADDVDLTDVDFMQMDTLRFTPSFVLDRIVAVPEPSALILLSMLLGFLFHRGVACP